MQMLLAAWMFDAIPWNPWVYLPIPVVPAVGLLLIIGAFANTGKDNADVEAAIGAFGVILLFVPLVWMFVMFFVNSELERRASVRAVRDACFEIMDEYAERVGLAENAGGHTGLMQTFLDLPEGTPGVDETRQAMSDQGCKPSQLESHLDGWDERNEKAAAKAERQAELDAQLKLLEEAGGPGTVLNAVESLP